MLYHLTDTDGGGEVSPGEFGTLLKILGWQVSAEQCEALILAMNAGNEPKAYRDARGQVCLKENVFVDHMVSGELNSAIAKLNLPERKNAAKKHEHLSNKDSLVKWVLTKGIVSRIMAGATSLLLLSHTPVSRKVFQFFHCHQLGDRAFLRADYSIECQSDGWWAFFPLVIFVLFSFTLALPGSISLYLWMNREKLYSASIQQKIGWLCK